MWKRRAKKWGGSLEDIHRGRIKRAYTMVSQCLIDRREEEARDMLLPFLKANADHEKNRRQVRDFFEKITFIQRRMTDKLVCKGSKLEVLLNYWEKIVF